MFDLDQPFTATAETPEEAEVRQIIERELAKLEEAPPVKYTFGDDPKPPKKHPVIESPEPMEYTFGDDDKKPPKEEAAEPIKYTFGDDDDAQEPDQRLQENDDTEDSEPDDGIPNGNLSIATVKMLFKVGVLSTATAARSLLFAYGQMSARRGNPCTVSTRRMAKDLGVSFNSVSTALKRWTDVSRSGKRGERARPWIFKGEVGKAVMGQNDQLERGKVMGQNDQLESRPLHKMTNLMGQNDQSNGSKRPNPQQNKNRELKERDAAVAAETRARASAAARARETTTTTITPSFEFQRILNAIGAEYEECDNYIWPRPNFEMVPFWIPCQVPRSEAEYYTCRMPDDLSFSYHWEAAIPKEWIDEWKDAYPEVSVIDVLKKIKQRIRDTGDRYLRKPRDVRALVGSWLAREGKRA